MRRTILLAIGTLTTACGDGTAMCQLDPGSYLMTSALLSGDCEPFETQVIRIEPGFEGPIIWAEPGCDGAADLSADLCEVTYDLDCVDHGYTGVSRITSSTRGEATATYWQDDTGEPGFGACTSTERLTFTRQ